MAVSGTSTFELSVNQLLRRSFQLAGILNESQEADADDLAMARDLLGMELDALQGDGIVQQTVDTATLALVGGTAEYSLGDIVGVHVGPNNVVGTIVSSTDTETPVLGLSRHEYATAITNKTTEATIPTHAWVQQLGGSVHVSFWPVPSEATTFSYQKIRLIYDATPASTLDLARRRQKATCYAVAWQMALTKSKPADHVKMLKNFADEFTIKARLDDTEKTHIQLYVVGNQY